MPDSRSPSRGPLVTTSVKIALIRPLSSSGVTVWLMIERQTALMLSAAPATASSAAASHRLGMKPAAAIARPQIDDGADHDPAEPARVLDPAGA